MNALSNLTYHVHVYTGLYYTWFTHVHMKSVYFYLCHLGWGPLSHSTLQIRRGHLKKHL